MGGFSIDLHPFEPDLNFYCADIRRGRFTLREFSPEMNAFKFYLGEFKSGFRRFKLSLKGFNLSLRGFKSKLNPFKAAARRSARERAWIKVKHGLCPDPCRMSTVHRN